MQLAAAAAVVAVLLAVPAAFGTRHPALFGTGYVRKYKAREEEGRERARGYDDS